MGFHEFQKVFTNFGMSSSDCMGFQEVPKDLQTFLPISINFNENDI